MWKESLGGTMNLRRGIYRYCLPRAVPQYRFTTYVIAGAPEVKLSIFNDPIRPSPKVAHHEWH
jgi:hypothetical protein